MHSDQPAHRLPAGSSGTKRVAIFLDRDGTLNVKPPEGDYVRRRDEFHWLPEAAEGAATLAQAGFALFVVSNQRGVARGLVAEATLAGIEAEIQSALRSRGARIEAFRYCRHDLDAQCDCRKPSPGMILSLAAERGLRLDRSWMIGDSVSDVACGQRAGCRTVLLCEPDQVGDPGTVPDLVSPSLLHASALIVNKLVAEE
jgi:D-glycero-D-manno-heptose 1,7-bisphosphate phosphatase